MRKIGGNTTAVISIMETTTNTIGEQVKSWIDAAMLVGWLDLLTGEARTSSYNAKIQDSTHVFICDYSALKGYSNDVWKWDTFSFINGIIPAGIDGEPVDVSSENARMTIDGKRYAITMIDDPMNLHEHLEIFLKFTGGQ